MINTLTLNPAIDKNLYLDKVTKNVTNRVTSVVSTVGGKGTHVSMNLCQMGIPNRAFGVIRGSTGASILRSLQESGVDTCFICREDKESRTNYIIIENDNSCTTIAEKGPQLTAAELDALLDVMLESMGLDEFLVLSGDASNCENSFVYNEIVRRLKSKQPRIFLDASGETLRRGLDCAPFLIKPNQDELEMLCGFSLSSDEDVIRGIETLERYHIEVVAVSLGKRGSIVRFGQEYYKAEAPVVEARNTAGCGDSFLAALLCGYSQGMEYSKMLTFATAVSAATAASPLSVGYDSALALRLAEIVKVQRIK